MLTGAERRALAQKISDETQKRWLPRVRLEVEHEEVIPKIGIENGKLVYPPGYQPPRQSLEERVSEIRQDTKLASSLPTGLKCKWEGCEEPVRSLKGPFGGFCTKIQENGKTHRQMQMAKKQEEIPGYGRAGSVLNKNANEVKPEEKMSRDELAELALERDEIEAVTMIESWGLGFHLGYAVKLIACASLEDSDLVTVLKKARWYLDRKIASLEVGVDLD